MRHFLLAILAAGLWLTPCGGRAEDGGARAQGGAVAVIDFDYVDTSGEERDQRKEHEARLAAFMGSLKSDLAKSAQFKVVTPLCEPAPCSLTGTIMPKLLAASREAGADIVIIGGVHKMSTLVQWAKVEAHRRQNRTRPARQAVHFPRRHGRRLAPGRSLHFRGNHDPAALVRAR